MELYEELGIGWEIGVDTRSVSLLSCRLKIVVSAIWINILNDYFFFNYCLLLVFHCCNKEIFSFLFRFMHLSNVWIYYLFIISVFNLLTPLFSMSYTEMMKLSEINVFVCNLLNSIWNKLDGKVVVWIVCF